MARDPIHPGRFLADELDALGMSVPEVAAVLRVNKARPMARGALSEIWRHPLHTREFGSQLTNSLRCLQLEAHGYQVTVTELVGWEHSLKNELIIARHTGQVRNNAESRLREILRELNLDALCDRFIDSGKAG